MCVQSYNRHVVLPSKVCNEVPEWTSLSLSLPFFRSLALQRSSALGTGPLRFGWLRKNNILFVRISIFVCGIDSFWLKRLRVCDCTSIVVVWWYQNQHAWLRNLPIYISVASPYTRTAEWQKWEQKQREKAKFWCCYRDTKWWHKSQLRIQKVQKDRRATKGKANSERKRASAIIKGWVCGSAIVTVWCAST